MAHSSTTDGELDQLRKAIASTDNEIMRLIKKRMDLSLAVGRYKKRHNLPVKNFQVEKKIFARVSQQCLDAQLEPELGQEIFKTLIDYSCSHQDNYLRQQNETNSTNQQLKKTLVVGGAGNMGRWFCQYLEVLGHQVSVYDPAYTGEDYNHLKDLNPTGFDFIILAAPMLKSAELLMQLTNMKFSGLVIEICSLKAPIIKHLQKAREAGLAVASIHPMFGPDVHNLVGRNILICTSESHEQDHRSVITDLFSDTTANIMTVPLIKHDGLMSHILGSAHLLNILFVKLLRDSGFAYEDLKALGGTTFLRQLGVASEVAIENQDLYFEIQSLNAQTTEIISGFMEAFAEFGKAITSDDRSAFKQIMTKNLRFLKL